VGSTITVVARYTDEQGTDENVASNATAVVTNVNDAPLASNTTINASEDSIFNATLPAATDADGDAVTYALETAAANGTAVVNADGSFNYTPDLNSNAPDSFTYTVSDGNGGSNTYTVNINVAAVNDAPSVTSNALTAATEDAAYSYTITTSDVDGDIPTITASALPAWLALVDNGDGTATLSGTPANADVGDHRVELEIFDGEFIDIQDFTVTVSGATIAPPADEDDPELRSSTNPDPEIFENPETDDEQDPYVEAPTHEDQEQAPVIEDEQADLIEESLALQESTDGDHHLVDINDAEIEENEEIIDLTDEIDPDSLSEGREDDPSITFFDNDLYKEIHPSDYLAYNFAAINEPIPIIEEGFSILDLDTDDANLVDLNENYDLYRQEIDESFNTELKSQGIRAKIVSITATSFAAGFVSYLLRAGSLVANLMSTLPLWRGFDPIVIFSGDKKKKKDRKDIPKTHEPESNSETLFDDK
jgi:VCBS repeat-containing protein